MVVDKSNAKMIDSSGTAESTAALQHTRSKEGETLDIVCCVPCL